MRVSRRTVSTSAVVVAVGVLLGVAWQVGVPETEFSAAAVVPAAARAGAAAPQTTPSSSASSSATSAAPLPAVAAPKDLPVIDYGSTPTGFPADLEPTSTVPVTSGLHPSTELAVYDAPGGVPHAFLPPTISGLRVTVPIIDRRAGWVAVLLPSVDRRVGWITDQGFQLQRLHDQLVVRLSTHQLTWLRDGVEQASWTVATGAPSTPTPLGRTFVLGPTPTNEDVYAAEDALVLGAVPENREALAPSLRAGHTAIHGWYRPSAFGHSVSNGCVRIPKTAQHTLLRNIQDGTAVHIVS